MSDRDAFREAQQERRNHGLKGHPFASEADCLLPDGWDNFMCRACVQEAIGDPA